MAVQSTLLQADVRDCTAADALGFEALVTFAFGHAVILPFPASFARHIFEHLFLDHFPLSQFWDYSARDYPQSVRDQQEYHPFDQTLVTRSLPKIVVTVAVSALCLPMSL